MANVGTRPVEMYLYKIVNGMAWPFVVTFMLPIDYPDELSRDMDTLTKILLAKGIRPMPVTMNPPKINGSPNMPVNMAEKSAMEIPVCPTHHEPMAKSKHQKKKGKVFFYCPLEAPGGYCEWRATVPSSGGEGEVWKSTKQ